MKRHIIHFILLLLVFTLSSCTIAFPIIASQKHVPNYNEIYDINKIYKNSIIKITTTDYELIQGEVLKKELFDTPEYVNVSKIINDSNHHYFPKIGDTLTIETMTTTYTGEYQFFDFYKIFILDKSGNLQGISINAIDEMTCKNREFDIFTINRLIKSTIPYELVILHKGQKVHVPSSKVYKIQRMKFEPVIPFAFLTGCSVDMIIWIIFILSVTGFPVIVRWVK